MRTIAGIGRLEPMQTLQIRQAALLTPPAPPDMSYRFLSVPTLPPSIPPSGRGASPGASPGPGVPMVELTLCNATGLELWVAIIMPGGAPEVEHGAWMELAAEGEARCGRLPRAPVRSAAYYYGLGKAGRIEGEAPFCLDPAGFGFWPYVISGCPEGVELVGFRPLMLDQLWMTEEIALAVTPPDETGDEGEGD